MLFFFSKKKRSLTIGTLIGCTYGIVTYCNHIMPHVAAKHVREHVSSMTAWLHISRMYPFVNVYYHTYMVFFLP